jgi:hypothetical protein
MKPQHAAPLATTLAPLAAADPPILIVGAIIGVSLWLLSRNDDEDKPAASPFQHDSYSRTIWTTTLSFFSYGGRTELVEWGKCSSVRRDVYRYGARLLRFSSSEHQSYSRTSWATTFSFLSSGGRTSQV